MNPDLTKLITNHDLTKILRLQRIDAICDHSNSFKPDPGDNDYESYRFAVLFSAALAASLALVMELL